MFSDWIDWRATDEMNDEEVTPFFPPSLSPREREQKNAHFFVLLFLLKMRKER